MSKTVLFQTIQFSISTQFFVYSQLNRKHLISNNLVNCPVGRGSRIHRLHLCRGVRHPHPPNGCPGYDTKQSDGEVPVMLLLWGMRSTPSLPLFPGPLWPRVVEPDKSPINGLNETKLWFLDFTVFCI